MNGRWALTLIAVAALAFLVVVGWQGLVGSDVGEPLSAGLDEPTPGGARLGRPGTSADPTEPARATPKPDARGEVAGRVVDETGRAVTGAVVFALPKNQPGADSIRFRTVTDAAGAFQLPRARLVGCWLGVRADSFGLAHLDADALPDEDLLVTLRPGPVLELDLRVRGAVEGEASLLITSMAEETSDRHPGPDGAVRIERRLRLAVPGVHRVHLSGAGGVIVSCDSARLAWTPRRARVDRLPGTAILTFGASGRVVVRVRDEATGRRFLDVGRLAAVDLDAGEEVTHREGRGPGGRHVLQRHLAPGRYRFSFETPGYLPWSSEPVTLSEEKPELTLSARIVRDEGLGDITLRSDTVHRVAWRSAGDGEGAWRGAVVQRSESGLRLRALSVGAIDLLLWRDAGPSSRVAFLGAVDVKASAATSVTPRWRPGIRLEVPRAPASPYRVRHARLGWLPAYDADAPAAENGPWPLAYEGDGGLLGPYPFDDLSLEPMK